MGVQRRQDRVRHFAIHRGDYAPGWPGIDTGKESPTYAVWLGNLANMYADAGDLANSERAMREALAIIRRIQSGTDYVASEINNLATILVDEGKCGDAIPLHEESLALRRKLHGEPS